MATLALPLIGIVLLGLLIGWVAAIVVAARKQRWGWLAAAIAAPMLGIVALLPLAMFALFLAEPVEQTEPFVITLDGEGTGGGALVGTSDVRRVLLDGAQAVGLDGRTATSDRADGTVRVEMSGSPEKLKAWVERVEGDGRMEIIGFGQDPAEDGVATLWIEARAEVK